MKCKFLNLFILIFVFNIGLKNSIQAQSDNPVDQVNPFLGPISLDTLSRELHARLRWFI